MICKTPEQRRIDAALSKKKRQLLITNPVCMFCGRLVKPYDAELAHKVRRSWASRYYSRCELQTMDLNIGLTHHDCHVIFDNEPDQAVYLPRIGKILADIKKIDKDYFQLINSHMIKNSANK